MFLKRNTTNIIIAVNDTGTLSIDVHLDIKPLEINFMLDQVGLKLCYLSMTSLNSKLTFLVCS